MNRPPAVHRRVEGREQHVMLVLPTAIIDLTPRQAERLRDELDRASLPVEPCRFCANLRQFGDLCGPCADEHDEMVKSL